VRTIYGGRMRLLSITRKGDGQERVREELKGILTSKRGDFFYCS